MFLHVCVILFTGGVSGQPPLDLAGRTPPPGPGRENPPRDLAGRNPPRALAGRTPPRPGREDPPGPGREEPPPRDLAVNERPVRILLECILVYIKKYTGEFWTTDTNKWNSPYSNSIYVQIFLHVIECSLNIWGNKVACLKENMICKYSYCFSTNCLTLTWGDCLCPLDCLCKQDEAVMCRIARKVCR